MDTKEKNEAIEKAVAAEKPVELKGTNVEGVREGNEATLKITVPAKEVKASFEAAINRIATNAKIPGFRKGKAPRKIIEMRFGKAAVKEEAFDYCVNVAYQKMLDDMKLIPVSAPSVQDEKGTFEGFEEGKEFTMTVKVTLKPEVELGDYKELHVEKKVKRITKKEVDKALEELRNRGAKMVAADDDAVIEKGDFAIIDFAGTVDGEAFSGGEGKGYPLEVGSGSFIPGFEDQLIGLKKDDDTDVDVTFPEEYFVKELAGKQAIFKVHIQAVKRKELPELNDEFIAAHTQFKTLEEAQEEYKKMMKAAAERDAEVEYNNALIDLAVDNAIVDIPEVMVEDRITQMVEEIRLSLESRKMTLDAYLQYTGMDMMQLREAQREGAAKNVRTDLVLDAIAKAENIQVTMEDVDAELQALANQHGAKLEDVKKIIQSNNNMGLLLANILRRKAAHVVLSSAK